MHPSVAALMLLLRDAVLYVHCSCEASCLLHTRTHQHTNRTSSHIMSCGAGDLCQLPNIELTARNGRDCGHECRGGCGCKLHGTCSEVEDPGGDNDNHRICHTCISNNRSLSNPAKRKQEQDFVLPRASKKTSGAAGAKKPRKRLNLGEKLEALALLDGKVSYAEIARRYGCGTTAIGTVEITATLNALSVGTKGGGVQDFVTGMPATPAAIKAVEFWVELEERKRCPKLSPRTRRRCSSRK